MTRVPFLGSEPFSAVMKMKNWNAFSFGFLSNEVPFHFAVCNKTLYGEL